MCPADSSFRDVDELVDRLSGFSKVEASKKLTRFYVTARLRHDDSTFERQYVDGSDDAGIDYFHTDLKTYYVIQAKFSAHTIRTQSKSIIAELRKLTNALAGTNPNRRAEPFVSDLKSSVRDARSTLEYIWLTTNSVDSEAIQEVRDWIRRFKRRIGWRIDVDFAAIDRHSPEGVVYDIRHGFVPYTGRLSLPLQQDSWFERPADGEGVYSVTCTVKVTDLLDWFRGRDIKDFLQKNVRGFLGDKKVNKDVVRSFEDDPEWFWYKHNGVIIVADEILPQLREEKLTVRNPQIVNGGQTVTSLFKAYRSAKFAESDAEILLRLYRLPYEGVESDERSIEIISALNSQNKILDSDLHSNDPRQIRVERMLQELGFEYIRKRESGRHASVRNISMRDLGLRFKICLTGKPSLGVGGSVEDVFKSRTSYNSVFPTREINKPLQTNHPAVKYLTCWLLDKYMQGASWPSYIDTYLKYVRYYALSEAYRVTWAWKQTRGISAGDWRDFLLSTEFKRQFLVYAKAALSWSVKMRPPSQEAITYYKRVEAERRFLIKKRARMLRTRLNKAWTLVEPTL